MGEGHQKIPASWMGAKEPGWVRAGCQQTIPHSATEPGSLKGETKREFGMRWLNCHVNLLQLTPSCQQKAWKASTLTEPQNSVRGHHTTVLRWELAAPSGAALELSKSYEAKGSGWYVSALSAVSAPFRRADRLPASDLQIRSPFASNRALGTPTSSSPLMAYGFLNIKVYQSRLSTENAGKGTKQRRSILN